MDWINQLGSILEHYRGAQADQAPHSVDDDFERFTQAAPQSALADALAAAFRSDQTPPFGRMVAQLFDQSGAAQRANILNTLITVIGPAVISRILTRSGASGLAGLLGSGHSEVTPEMAEQVSPETIEQVAVEAEKKDSSVIDLISNIYANQPALIKTLGSAALTVALAKIAQRRDNN